MLEEESIPLRPAASSSSSSSPKGGEIRSRRKHGTSPSNKNSSDLGAGSFHSLGSIDAIDDGLRMSIDHGGVHDSDFNLTSPSKERRKKKISLGSLKQSMMTTLDVSNREPVSSPTTNLATIKSLIYSQTIIFLIIWIGTVLYLHHQQEEANLIKNDEWEEQHYQDQLRLRSYPSSDENEKVLQDKVKTLSKALQTSSAQHLQQNFGKIFVEESDSMKIEMNLLLGVAAESFTIILDHKSLPYTTWTLLNQIQSGWWTHSQVHVNEDENLVEIKPLYMHSSQESNIIQPKLAYFETHPHENVEGNSVLDPKTKERIKIVFKNKDRYVVGIKNPPKGVHLGIILTIHIDQDTCGGIEDQENEICVGKVTRDGHKTLNKIMSNHNRAQGRGDPPSNVVQSVTIFQEDYNKGENQQEQVQE